MNLQVSRRGFLQVLTTAAVGMAAAFDPLKGLWVPATVAAGPVQTFTAEVIAEQLELNDLALRFAHEMGERLQRHPSLVLRQVMCQHAGHVRLVGSLAVNDVGSGYFRPGPRIMKTGEMRLSAAFVRDRADDTIGSLSHVDVFAPISAELRRGEPFTDTLVGVATDPASGLSARALRWRHGEAGPVLTGVELSGGQWLTHSRGQRTHDRVAEIYLSDALTGPGGCRVNTAQKGGWNG